MANMNNPNEIFDYVRYSKHGRYIFSRNIFGKPFIIDNEWTAVTYEQAKRLNLRLVRNDDGTPSFEFKSDIERIEPDPDWERKSIDREIARDNALTELKKEQKAQTEQRASEKESLENSDAMVDKFGPLENTPGWDELSSYKKGGIRKQREQYYGFRIVAFKGGVQIMGNKPLSEDTESDFISAENKETHTPETASFKTLDDLD